MSDRILREKLTDAYLDAIPLITLNVIWFLASLPVITAIPATAGLFYATNRIAHGQSAGLQTFLEGFRHYFWWSWLWGILNVAVAAVLGSNFFYYSVNPAGWTVAAQVIITLVALIWVAVQMHTFPLLIEQEQPRLLLALRNSLVILLKRPLYSFGMALLISLIAVGSALVMYPTWIFITASLCTYLANQATINAIVKIAGKTPTPSEQPQ